MTIDEINQLANDILVSREMINILQGQIDKIIKSHPDIVALQEKLNDEMAARSQKQNELLVAMDNENLKQWKTEKGTISRAERITAKPVAGFDKTVKELLLEGEEVKGWELKKTEYISIRSNKK